MEEVNAGMNFGEMIPDFEKGEKSVKICFFRSFLLTLHKFNAIMI